MADWTLPVNTSSYLNVLVPLLSDKDIDAYTMAETPTSPPVGAMRYLRATNTFEEWDGALWNVKVVSILSGGTGANTAASARTNLGLGSMATQNNNAVNITGGTAVLSTLLATDSTFIGALVRVVNAAPNIRLNANTQPLDGKFWNIVVSANNFLISALNDAETTGNVAIQIVRNATTITDINFDIVNTTAGHYAFKTGGTVRFDWNITRALNWHFLNGITTNGTYYGSEFAAESSPFVVSALLTKRVAGSSGFGSQLFLGRSSDNNGAPGYISLTTKTGDIYTLWVDSTGKLRINFNSSPNATGNDTIGTVVGTQT